MTLSDTTKQSLVNHVNIWRRIGLSTARSDRAASERAVRDAYRIVGLEPPSRFLWLDSPMAGAIAAAQVASAFESMNHRVWLKPQEFMTKKLWKKADASRSTAFWKDIEAYINGSPLLALRNNVLIPIGQQLVSQPADRTLQARVSVFVRGHHSGSNLSADVWNKAVTALKQELTQKEIRKLDGTPTWERIAEQLRTCSYGNMDAMFLAFLDYGNMAGFQLSDIDGVISVARSNGWWWTFNDLCIITDRPKSISLNRQGQLHRERGYAVEYCDQWGVYALNGKVVTKEVSDNAVEITIQEKHAGITYSGNQSPALED